MAHSHGQSLEEAKRALLARHPAPQGSRLPDTCWSLACGRPMRVPSATLMALFALLAVSCPRQS